MGGIRVWVICPTPAISERIYNRTMTRGVKSGTTREHYAVEAMEKQRAVIDGYLRGQSWTEALRVAGYNETSALHYSKKEFLNSKGVQRYINQMDNEAQKRFGESLPDKVMGVYFDGLEATKAIKVGQQTEERPDWLARKSFADKFSEFFGWSREQVPTETQNQYNFFSIPKSEQETFNQKFKEFLRTHYQ